MTKVNRYKHYIIALAIAILILVFVPPANGLTRMGVHVLAVLVPILYLWVLGIMDWTSLLCCAGLIITGVMSAAAVWQGSIGSTVFILVLVCMVLNNLLRKHGITENVARWFVTRKIVKGRPYMFITMFLFSNFILGFVLEPLALTITYIMIAEAFLKEMGYQKGERFYTAVMLSLLWINSISAMNTPISTALPLFLMNQVYTVHGVYISWLQWMSVGIPYSILAFAVMLIVIRFFWKIDTTKYASYDIEKAKSEMKKLTPEGKLTAVLSIMVIVVWLFPEFTNLFGVLPGITSAMRSVGFAVPPIIAISIMCIVHINDKPVAVFKEVTTDIPLGVLFFLGAILLFGSAFNNPDAGINAALVNIFRPITEGLNPFILVGIILVFAQILTKFIAITVTMLVFTSIALPILAGSGLSLGGVTIVIGLAAGLGALVPSSTVTAPLLFGPGHITFANSWKHNLLYLVLMYAPMVFILFPLANAIV